MKKTIICFLILIVTWNGFAAISPDLEREIYFESAISNPDDESYPDYRRPGSDPNIDNGQKRAGLPFTN